MGTLRWLSQTGQTHLVEVVKSIQHTTRISFAMSLKPQRDKKQVRPRLAADHQQ